MRNIICSFVCNVLSICSFKAMVPQMNMAYLSVAGMKNILCWVVIEIFLTIQCQCRTVSIGVLVPFSGVRSLENTTLELATRKVCTLAYYLYHLLMNWKLLWIIFKLMAHNNYIFNGFFVTFRVISRRCKLKVCLKFFLTNSILILLFLKFKYQYFTMFVFFLLLTFGFCT